MITLVWFASSPDIRRMGPFASPVEAGEALREHGRTEPISGGRVWCERATEGTLFALFLSNRDTVRACLALAPILARMRI